MGTNSTEAILQGAKNTLAKATNFTKNVEGNPTSSFAPPAPAKPKIPQTHKDASYSLAHQARQAGADVAAGLKAKADNVNQYVEATKNQ